MLQEDQNGRVSAALSSRSKASRSLYAALGVGCVALGVVGAVLPIMPSTVFFIVALWAFKRSSSKLETWLLTNSLIGPTLQDWDRDRSMRRSTKVLAIVTIWVAIGGSILLVHKLWVQVMLACLALALTVYLSQVKEATS